MCAHQRHTQQTPPLPDDPGVLKLLLAAKDGELAALKKYVDGVEEGRASLRAQIMALESGCRMVVGLAGSARGLAGVGGASRVRRRGQDEGLRGQPGGTDRPRRDPNPSHKQSPPQIASAAGLCWRN